MITIFDERINIENHKYINIQEIYYQIIGMLPALCTVHCPTCGAIGCLIFWGFYMRSCYDEDGDKEKLYIQRVMCKLCLHTHALLPSYFVPYRSYLLKVYCQILRRENDLAMLDVYLNLTEADLARIRHQGRGPVARLTAIRHLIEEQIYHFLRDFIEYEHIQFMQVRKHCRKYKAYEQHYRCWENMIIAANNTG